MNSNDEGIGEGQGRTAGSNRGDASALLWIVLACGIVLTVGEIVKHW